MAASARILTRLAIVAVALQYSPNSSRSDEQLPFKRADAWIGKVERVEGKPYGDTFFSLSIAPTVVAGRVVYVLSGLQSTTECRAFGSTTRVVQTMEIDKVVDRTFDCKNSDAAKSRDHTTKIHLSNSSTLTWSNSVGELLYSGSLRQTSSEPVRKVIDAEEMFSFKLIIDLKKKTCRFEEVNYYFARKIYGKMYREIQSRSDREKCLLFEA